MKDCGYAIRKGYYDKLHAASYSLGVYDTIAPDEANPPFLIISSQTSAEDSDKTSFNFNVSIQFDIIYRTFKDGEVGQKAVDDYTNELLGIIGVGMGSYPDVSPYFNIVTRKLVKNDGMFDYIDESYIYRRVLIMEHFVNQL